MQQEMKLKELKNGRLAASFYAADCVLGGKTVVGRVFGVVFSGGLDCLYGNKTVFF